MTRAILAVPAVLAIGCATVARDADAVQVRSSEGGGSTNDGDLDPSRASLLEPGVATLEDAKRLFGEPVYTSIQEDNKLLCVWSSAASGQMSIGSKTMTLVFGPDGRLLGSR
jgi:hypothetical protein